LACHWTDPHCPLWMMTRAALAKVLPRITNGGNWTWDAIRKRLKTMSRAGAVRFPGQPIVDVQFGGPGWMGIKEFTILGGDRAIGVPTLEYSIKAVKSRRRASWGGDSA